MALRFECPVCKHVLTARDDCAGKKARCPACAYVMVVPSASTLGNEPPVDSTDLLAMLGDRPIEPRPAKKEKDHKAEDERRLKEARQRAQRPDVGDTLRPDQDQRDDKSRQREKNRGVWGVFVADCFRCADALMGLSSVLFMVALLLVLAAAAFAGEILLFRSSNGRAAQGLLDFILTAPGRGIVILLGTVLSLYVTGYFTAYFIETTAYKLKSLSLAPCFPGLAPLRLMGTGLKGLAVMLVYVAPVVTIPLLPLGIMALAQTEDWRAFDLLWAAKAALRRPKALAVAWLVILLFGALSLGALATLWPFLGSFLHTDSLGSMQGPVLTLVLLAVGVTLSLVVGTVFGAIAGSVSGVLGWHFPELVTSIPPRSQWGGSIASGGVVAAVGIIVTAASSLGRPFLFSYNIRQVTTLAWFFADGFTTSAPAGHLSPEPDKWEVAWNDFFPIKPPPAPATPSTRGTPRSSEPIATAAPRNETPDESAPVPTPAPTAAPTPTPPANPQPVAARKPRTSSEATDELQLLRTAIASYRQAHEGKNPPSLAELTGMADKREAALKYLPAQPDVSPVDDILVYDATKYPGDKAVVINQQLVVVTMSAQELRRRMQEQSSRPGGQTERRTARVVFLRNDCPTVTDDVTAAQAKLANLMADLQEYSDLHAGQFPSSLAELKSLANAKSEDLANAANQPYVYIPGQSIKAAAGNVLAYDPTEYKDVAGRAVALYLQVDGQAPIRPGEDLTALRKLLDKQSPLVADTLKPNISPRPTPPPAVAGNAAARPDPRHAAEDGAPSAPDAAQKSDVVDWETPDLSAVDAVNHCFHKICQATKEFKDGTFFCFGGVIIGPEAAGKKDETYPAFCKQMERRYNDVLALETGVRDRKEITQKLGGVEYDRINAYKGMMLITQLRTVDNGHCVCYWYHGTSEGFTKFIATALGKAKLKS